MLKHWTLIAVSAIALAGCDVVRVPGGDHQNEPRPVIPDGAPGPAPPTVPVTDPYGEGEEPVQIPVNNPDPVDETTGSRDDETSEETPPTDPAPDDVAPVEDEVPADPTDPVVVDPDPVIDDPDSAPIDAVDPGTDAPVEEPDGTDLVEAPSEPDPEPLPVKFEFFAPGDLLPGSGFGRADDTVYAPAMVFPIKSAPTYLNSQVYRPGGGVGGDQCDVSNYSMPWRDNFCETRTSNRTTPLCSLNKVHQGQDLRTGTATECLQMRSMTPSERGLHEAVATEDGIIQYIGSYSLQLRGADTGFVYHYVHLNMRRLQVTEMQTVKAGDVIGVVSNDFGGTPTTYHLHFEIKAPVEGEGIVHVPPYMSLVSAYERREGGIGKVVEDDTVEVASAPVIIDPSWLID
ncbi:MAG: M23 family metallopeptidase [Pseudomonadota bacterium]